MAGRGRDPIRSRPESRWGLHAALALAVVAGYALAGLRGPFLFDDLTAIVENRSLASGSLADALWPAADTAASGRPVVSLSLAADRALHGLDPAGFRALNLALHVLVCAVLFDVVRRLLRSDPVPERVRDRADGFAFATALLFGLHPLASEPVLYVIARTELWMALFLLVVVDATIRAASSDTPGRWTAVAVVASALGMLSKETMAVAPLCALLADRTFLAGSFRLALSRRAVHYAGLASTWLVLAFLLRAGARAGSVGFDLGRSGLGYALAQGEMILRYLGLCLWPHPLVFDYGPASRTPHPGAWVGAVLVLALVALVLVLLWRRPVLGFAGAWVLLVLAPTSSFVPIATEVGAERRIYLGLPAVLAVLVAAGELLGARGLGPRWRTARWAVLGVLVLALEAGLVRRAREYATAVSIWTTVVERRPQNPRGHYNLGVALWDRGRTEEALARYREAVRLDPEYPKAWSNLAGALIERGRFEEALEPAREAARLSPRDATPTSNRALASYALGRLDEAEALFRGALAIDPAHPQANLGLGRLLLGRGRPKEAREFLSRALAARPQDAELRRLVALAEKE